MYMGERLGNIQNLFRQIELPNKILLFPKLTIRE